ncbi:MAG: DUF4132 domain-containing protein, partial [Prochlorotrichaceae cyanobacterium]
MTSLMPTPQPRSLPLAPADWFWAMWREPQPLPLPEARAFVPTKLLTAFKKQPRTVNSYFWPSLEIPRSLTQEEAQFWLTAMTCPPPLASWSLTTKTLLLTLEEAMQKGGQDLPNQEEALAALGKAHQTASPQLILPLLHYFDPETIVGWILDPTQFPVEVIHNAYQTPRHQIEAAQSAITTALILGWQQFAVPYLTLVQRDRCRHLIREVLDRTVWRADYFKSAPPVYYLAASLGGFGEALQRLIATWPEDSYRNLYQGAWMSGADYVARQQTRPQEILFGLADPDRMAFEMQRLGLRLNRLSYVKGWLAHTEYQELPWLQETLLNLNRKEHLLTLMRHLITIVAPELAPIMLDLTQNPATAELASRWLTDYPQVAMAGILGDLRGKPQISQAVQKYLQRRLGRGDGEWMQHWVTEQVGVETLSDGVNTALTTLWTAEASPPLDPERMPAALQAGFAQAQLGQVKLPKWLDAGDLTPLQCQDAQGETRSFLRQHMETVLQACRHSTLSEPHPLLLTLKQCLPPAGLAAFAGQLFERWLAVGAPPKDQWTMQPLGLLGNDTTVLQLTPLIRAWPGEGKHKRAIVGLECLKAIGTDTALMQIHAIAQRIKFKSLKTKAVECMETLAQERGISQEQLEDRIVPDCGLNAQGSKVYDYGGRQFRVVLSADLKPQIRDPQNKLKANLPRPTKTDDRTLAEAAIADWQVLKKTLGQVVSLQAKRLERGMIEQRRWQRSEFETYVLGHPVLLNLAQRLIWGAYSPTSTEFVTTFRITEDGTSADSEDEDIEVPPNLELGIVHPAEFTTAQRQQWGQLLSDYEIVPPFSQLARTVFTLLPEEQSQSSIQRFAGAEVPSMVAAAIFKSTGWEQRSYHYFKPFPQSNLTAIVSFDSWGYTIPLGEIYFVPGLSTTSGGAALPLLEISPVILSEVLRNIGAIASKANT